MNLEHFSLVSDEQYYKAPILSKSGLYAFKAEIQETPNYIKAKPETLRLGQLFHLATYEPLKYIQQPEHDLATGLDLKTLNQIARMAVAARNNPLVASYLRNKQVAFEKPVVGLINGSYVKVKPDAGIFQKNGHGHDLKSTACRSLDEFIQSCIDYNYFSQAYMYKEVAGFKNYYFTGVSKAEIFGKHQVYTVDVSKHKKEMKEAKEEVYALLDLHRKILPTYQNQSFNYLANLANGQA